MHCGSHFMIPILIKASKRGKLRVINYLIGFHTEVESWTFPASPCSRIWHFQVALLRKEAVAEVGSTAQRRSTFSNTAESTADYSAMIPIKKKKLSITEAFSQPSPIWPTGNEPGESHKLKIVPKLMQQVRHQSKLMLKSSAPCSWIWDWLIASSPPYRTSLLHTICFPAAPCLELFLEDMKEQSKIGGKLVQL